MQDFLNQTIFTANSWSLTVVQLLLLTGLYAAAFILYRLFSRSHFFSKLMNNSNIETSKQRDIRRKTIVFILILLLLLSVLILNLDDFFPENSYGFSFSLILEVLLIFQGARILDWMLSYLFIHKYYSRRDEATVQKKVRKKEGEGSGTKIIQYIVYLFAILFLIKNLGLDDTISSTLIRNDEGEVIKEISWTWTKIIVSVLIILVARLVVWLTTQLFLYGVYQRQGVDKGSQFAFNQLIAYFIYIIAVFVALENLGINMTLIWTGAAALLVGVGLGLQQTFNDFVSGVVLLFERSTSVGDVLEFGGNVGKIQKIGMRASIVQTRHNISMIVPNSKLVNDNVINWSHYYNKVRFEIKVGVAYGSDTSLVKKILIDVAKANNDVMDHPEPFVRFMDFGNSSLDFSLSFFSRNYLLIEDVMSDLRFEIDRQFREQGITIPFPQRDIWLRNP